MIITSKGLEKLKKLFFEKNQLRCEQLAENELYRVKFGKTYEELSFVGKIRADMARLAPEETKWVRRRTQEFLEKIWLREVITKDG